MEMIEVKTSDLIGPALDWAVAKAEGLDCGLWKKGSAPGYCVIIKSTFFCPATKWSDCGPLIEKYKVLISPPTSSIHRNFGYMDKRNGYYESGFWSSTIFGAERKHRRTAFNHPDSALVVACRAIAQFQLGDTVSVPKELMQ